jgi:hypothetical protein
MLEQARFFVQRLIREAGEKDTGAQIERAFQLAFSRPPKPQELAASEDLIRRHGLLIFCRALLNANEFIYLM